MLSALYCFREELTFQSETVCLVRSGSSCRRARARNRHICTKKYIHINWVRTLTLSHLHKHTNAFGRMPYVKVCRCECVFMQLRLKWDDSVFIWSLSSCYNSYSFSQSGAFLLPLRSLILMGDRHQKSNSVSHLGPAPHSEHDLEIQTLAVIS